MAYDLTAYFSAIDYAIFGGMLLVSAIIGIYFAFFAKKKQNTPEEYLMGGKTMGIFPIAMSLVASNISGVSMMGIPSEVYTFGTQLSLSVVGEIIAYIIGAYTFLPVLYELGLMSSYEYLELRFNRTLRKLGSLCFVFGNILYIPIVIYVPALAFAQTTGVSLQVLIPLVCIVCIFYTTLGGLKAVVWTDTFQTMMILIGVVSVVTIGTYNVGGVGEVFRRGMQSDRLELFNMDWDLTIRHTFWSVLIGQISHSFSTLSVNQSMVQRYVAMPTLRKARIANSIMIVGAVTLRSFCFYTGLVIAASLWNCDPVTLGYVIKPDSIMPYFIMKFTRNVPAIPGIFMAGVFSASLSTMSTCLNAMCGVIYEDFIKPNLKKPMSEARASLLMKVLVVIIGIITMFLSTVVEKLGGIIQLSASLTAITMGSLVGIYILGMSCPWANSKGAIVGGIVSPLLVGWVSVGAQLAISRKEIVFPWKPFSVDACDNATLTAYMMRNVTEQVVSNVTTAEPFSLFKLSYIYFTTLGILTSFIVGLLVSWATGFQDPAELNPNLLFHFIRKPFKEIYDKKQQEKMNEMSPDELKKLLAKCGGEIK